MRYGIHYGAPIQLGDGLGPSAADDPAVVSAAALRVRRALEELLAGALAARPRAS